MIKNQPIVQDKNKEKIINCLKSLIKNINVSEKKEYSIILNRETEYYKEILESLLLFHVDSTESERRKIVNSAIFRWLAYTRKNTIQKEYGSFMRAVIKEEEIYRKKRTNFSVIFFLNIDISNYLQKLVLSGYKVEKINWCELENVSNDNLWYQIWFYDGDNPIIIHNQDNNKNFPNSHHFIPYRIKLKGENEFEVAEIVNRIHDLLRSIINLAFIIGVIYYFRDYQTSLTKVPPSPIFLVLNNDEKLVKLFHPSEKYVYPRINRELENDRFVKNIKFLTEKFGKDIDSKNIWFHLQKIILLYQRSLDCQNIDSAFLAMWQVLENSININERRIDFNEVKGRVKNLIHLSTNEALMFDIVCEKRNRFVHYGKFAENSDRYYFALKKFVDLIIISLINKTKI